MKLITDADLLLLKKVEKLIDVADKTDETKLDWENVELQEVMQRAIYNLKHGANYYRPVPSDDTKHTYCKCDKCNWEGSSKYLLGGGQIADTGDYDDSYCPVCGSTEID